MIALRRHCVTVRRTVTSVLTVPTFCALVLGACSGEPAPKAAPATTEADRVPTSPEIALVGRWSAGAPLINPDGGPLMPPGQMNLRTNQILEWGDRLVVAADAGAPGEASSGLWMTRDGAVWTRHEVPKNVLCWADSMVSRGAQLLFACMRIDDRLDKYIIQVAGTTDLEHWSIHDVGTPAHFLTGVAHIATFRDTVLVAAYDAVNVNTFEGGHLRVWISTDLLQWKEVDPGTEVFQGAEIERVSAAPDRVVMGGWLRHDGPDRASPTAAAWTSTDGQTWTRTVLSDQASSDVIAVTQGPAGVVAVGSAGGAAAVWISNGASWQRVPDNTGELGGPEEQAMTGVVVAPDGTFLAVGKDGSRRDRAASWASVDGQRWFRLARGPDAIGVWRGQPVGVTRGPDPRLWTWSPRANVGPG